MSKHSKNILTIESLNLEMILNGDQWVVFTDEISESLMLDIAKVCPDNQVKSAYAPEKFYLCDKKTGLVIGEATTGLVYYLLYNTNEGHINGMAKVRNDAIKELYFGWCAKKSLKPNENEGWFKSKKFNTYLDEIGWGGNYALFLHDIIKYKDLQQSIKQKKREGFF